MSEENNMYEQDYGVMSALSDNVHEAETENYLIFRSCDALYGVNADYVVEIITETSVTHMPMVPAHVSGVVNLRGAIVPVLDFRLMLGLEASEKCIMLVLEIEGAQVGIMVDSVEQMLAIDKSSILPVPSQQAQSMRSDRMCTLPNGNGTMMVLDCAYLLNE